MDSIRLQYAIEYIFYMNLIVTIVAAALWLLQKKMNLPNYRHFFLIGGLGSMATGILWNYYKMTGNNSCIPMAVAAMIVLLIERLLVKCERKSNIDK